MERLFLAVGLPLEARVAAAHAQARMRAQLKRSRIAWVAPEQFHVTLHFLGETEQAEREELVRQLSVQAYADPFELHLGDVGAFPDKKKPHTLWLGTTGHPHLLALRQRTAQVLVGLGFDVDPRPFAPHITLGHVQVQSEVLKPEDIVVEHLGFAVDRFQLMSSREVGEKTVYETVASFPLGTG